MIENYKIDISKNIIWSKGTRNVQWIYISMFLFIAIFYVIYTLISGESWKNFPIALIGIIFSITSYLKMTGKWIYSSYFLINTDCIKGKKHFFDGTKLNWSTIEQINFEYSSIDFQLTTQKIKHFSLVNITARQINELKELMRKASIEKGIKYTAE